MKRMMLFAALFGLLLFTFAPQAAADITLTDMNSSVSITPDASGPGQVHGMYSWLVDGVDQMFEQWFWYRIGSTGPEQPIDTISAPTITGGGRSATITYTNATLEIDVAYTLSGGTPGSHTSDVAESIRIINRSSAPLDLHFFQYSDFDLNGVIGGQTARLVNANAVQQEGGGVLMNETVVTPTPNHHEVGLYPSTRNRLFDALPTTLNDVSVAGPGDAEWAFQWDANIAAGGTFLISKDKRLSAVPEPATIMLLGGCLILFARKFRKA